MSRPTVLAGGVVAAAFFLVQAASGQVPAPMPPKYGNVDVLPPSGLPLPPELKAGGSKPAHPRTVQSQKKEVPAPRQPVADAGKQPPAPTPAQATPPPPAPPTPKSYMRTPQQEYQECLGLWDKGTHMTRAEWAATCRRVQDRLKSVSADIQKSMAVNPGRRRAR